ncbi:hypothetical protein, partial [Chryseobacterium sp. SIMBA_029]|uniref:hypothetical protein n=1 Tax=Chryseobacterium sp. SIMBA_029 TaxID=3085772 RepID=UPI00397B6CEB
DIHGFLVDVAIRIYEELSSHGTTIHCAITVNVDERQRTLAASSPDARAFDELQSSYPAGPRLTAWQTHALIHVSNVAMEDRWSFFLRPAAARGLGSVLILPMDLDGAVEAAVNL